ncbi:hypothetical protein F8388_008111 [Cannabis sativa]|uniref:Cytochrome P450 n=2 Tax=Cannabis sativa TaxID=3483 RepID=A0A7J6EUX2_CANSA|nr:hypothetical protein F8388_008111 [Cannabis sativa]
MFGSSLIHHTPIDLAKKYGPLMHLKISEVPTIVISSPEFAKQVMRVHDVNFASRPSILFSKIMLYDGVGLAFAPYGEHWRQEAIEVSLGFELADLFPSFKLFYQMSRSKFKLEKLRGRAEKIFEEIIHEHKKQKPKERSDEDLVDVLLKYHDNDDLGFALTNENIYAINNLITNAKLYKVANRQFYKLLVLEIFAAGIETSATTVEWAMSELMKNPKIMKRAQDEIREVFHRKGLGNERALDEMKYLKSVIKESMRLHPILPLIVPRQNQKKCEINGYEIPAKTNTIINAWVIGRDSNYWPEPEIFKPERFLDDNNCIDSKLGNNFEYLPFGGGRRICVGMSFGLLSVELSLALLLFHFDWMLPNGVKNEDLDMTECTFIHTDQDKEIKSSTNKSGDEEDLVDVLLKFHETEDHHKFTLTMDNIKAVIFNIFGAGSNASATTLDWDMAELMRNPRVMKKAQDEVRQVFGKKGLVNESLINEMKYLKFVVNETLRLHPPASLLVPRESRKKCEINGYEIPMKTRIIVHAWEIGRDPKYWIESESFMPERFVDFKGNNFEYIPFGAGRRICPGMSFGLVSVELPLAIFLLYHFDWNLPNGMKHEQLDMTERFGIIISRKKDLCRIQVYIKGTGVDGRIVKADHIKDLVNTYFPIIMTLYMEFQQIVPSFEVLLFSVFMFIVVSILLKRAQTTSNNSASKLPPGPWRLPFLGNLHQLLGPFPHHTLRDLAQKHGPFMYLKIGQVPTIVVSSPEYAKEVMKTHDISFASRPKTLVAKTVSYDSTDISFAPYGEYWRELRKICLQELLSPSRVKTFYPIREEEAFNIVKDIASKVGSPINLSKMTRRLSYSITSRAAFGNKSNDHDEFISIMEEIVKLSGGFAFGDVFPSLSFLDWYNFSKFNHYKLRAAIIVERIIKLHTDQDKEIKSSTKKSGEEEDLVDVLLKFHKSEDHHKFTLTRDNLKAIIFNIFGAGSDTSATTIDWAMAEMMRNPRVMKKAQDEVRQVFDEKGLVDESSINEMKYLKSVVKETLRLHPPVAMLIPRESREKCEINGYEIPTKTRIIVNAWAIGRDSKHWIEPESFVPERFVDSSIDFKGNNFEYIPFGSGRRICPGISFGLINVELPLAFLLYHFDWNLPNGLKNEQLDMTERFGITICRKKDLYVIPSKYDPPSMVIAHKI